MQGHSSGDGSEIGPSEATAIMPRSLDVVSRIQAPGLERRRGGLRKLPKAAPPTGLPKAAPPTASRSPFSHAHDIDCDNLLDRGISGCMWVYVGAR